MTYEQQKEALHIITWIAGRLEDWKSVDIERGSIMHDRIQEWVADNPTP